LLVFNYCVNFTTNELEGKEVRMTAPKKRKSADVSALAERFLKDHPEAKKALEIFGVALEEYQQRLAAQQTPVFFTGSSTD